MDGGLSEKREKADAEVDGEFHSTTPSG
ncbi:hypothetical protein Tco_1257618, partial [Tanacetum coccineum]